jgi:UDP-glucose 4,6-dehydratase
VLVVSCVCNRTLHGTGRNTRNFLYVEDVARAFDTVLHKGLIGNIYNIGGSNEFSNIDVAKKLLQLMGKVGEDGIEAAVAKHIVFVPDRPFNDVHYHLDSSKLARLGWVEEVTWEDGLRRTLDWYRVNSGNWGDLTSALVAHPRRGLTASEMYVHKTTRPMAS